MTKKEAQELLQKYLNGTCTTEERILFESLDNKLFKEDTESDHEPDYDAIKAAIYKNLPKPDRKPLIKRLVPYAVAASVALCISAITFLYFNKNRLVGQNEQAQTHDVAPGGNKAVLTLANGKKIVLTDGDNGQLAKQAGISITKTKDGELVYSVVAEQESQSPVEYNTTETPRGGQYQIILADGSKVWLNAASSLKYPTRFGGKERIVELTGEGYFEIAHNEAMPFKVKTNKQVVTVLGTHFNVNAYEDEPSLRTTLLEGSVKVSTDNGTAARVLRPGQQSALTGNKIDVTDGDTEEAVAWKNGYFRFRGESIESIMRKLSRWYNIEVRYEGNVSGDYYGKVLRFKSISHVLKMLSKTESVHFKVEGRRITVMP